MRVAAMRRRMTLVDEGAHIRDWMKSGFRRFSRY
jgi:hypothetical protein